MYSNPTDRDRADGFASYAPPMKKGSGQPSQGILKRLLPRTLFGRSLLILITPLILVQAVATLVFYDRLWDTVMRRLSSSVAGDISLVLAARQAMPDDTTWRSYLNAAHDSTELSFLFRPGDRLPNNSVDEPQGQIERRLARAVTEHIPYRAELRPGKPSRIVHVLIQLDDGIMDVGVPEGRLWSSTSYIFILWMAGTAIITLTVATVFLRNQIKSLRRLATAAEAFGKGRDVANFRPEGASEVRQAAAAFLLMRQRIQRQITQRTEMLAGVSHDLRTPLTRMKLELEMLSDNEETAGLRSDIADMQQMIEGYLDFARGEGTEQHQVTDLVQLLDGIVVNAHRDGSQISLSAPPELHIAVRRDALRRALSNLTGNASRYGGHVWVTVVADRLTADIMIDDDGPGIPENQREAVFRPFLRLEASRNRETGGVGLGLPIARDIIRAHGGDIRLDTSPHGGLRAVVVLPR